MAAAIANVGGNKPFKRQKRMANNIDSRDWLKTVEVEVVPLGRFVLVEGLLKECLKNTLPKGAGA